MENPPPRPSPARGEGEVPSKRVQVAAHHWRARFVANGIDVNDFDTTVAKTTEWKDWGPNWRAGGEGHQALRPGAQRHQRTRSGNPAHPPAALCHYPGQVLLVHGLAP